MKHDRTGVKAYWNQLKITSKFGIAFGFLLFLVVLVGLASYSALSIVISQTESAIINSTEIRKLVLMMDANLEEARRLQREYFYHYTFSGGAVEEDSDLMVLTVGEQIEKTVLISTQLKQLIERSDASEALAKSKININFYLSSANLYKKNFQEAVSLVSRLINPRFGLRMQLHKISDDLGQIGMNTTDDLLHHLFHQMQLLEKDFWLHRQRHHMQSVFNVQSLINKRGAELASNDENNLHKLPLFINQYQFTANSILDLDVAITSHFNESDLQAKALVPISDELILLANQEVEEARLRIHHTNQIALMIILVTAALGLALTALIAYILNESITKNIIRLTNAAEAVRKGDLNPSLEIDSNDELGKLGESFNSMAGQLNSMVRNLEKEVALRTEHLANAKEEAEFANSAKSDFLANISHELRNPMHHILSYSKYGVEKFNLVKKEKLFHYFNQILKSANRLMVLLNDLLDLTKMEAGRMEYDFAENDVSKIVQEATEEMKPILDEKAIQIEINSSLEHHMARCDAFKIGQVVRNLVSNAVKFTPSGRRIEVTLSQNINQSPQNRIDGIEVAIRDYGVGIPDDEISTIFEKFTQSSKTKTGAGGTGLGLAICQEIIKAHKGVIWAENNTDQGATFRFIIPPLFSRD